MALKKNASRKRTRRIKRRSRRTRIPTSFNPIPDRLHVRLRYNDNYIFSTTTSAQVQAFRGNSIYDPDLTGAGHQPLYRDQYDTLYLRYFVIGSSISCTVVCPYGDQAMQFVLYPQVSDATTGAVTRQDAEKPRARSVIVAGGSQTKTIRMRASSSGMFGQRLSMNKIDDVYSSLMSGNPARIWYWILSAQNPDSVTASACVISVNITYDVILFDRIRQAQS